MLDDYIRALRDRQAEITGRLVGGVDSFDRYLKLVGEYRGLEYALETLEGKRDENEDGDND